MTPSKVHLLSINKVKSNPLVSVLLPAYNAEKYISEAINSILNQTYENFELIIVNDGSKDATLEVISSHKNPRIKLINLAENKGISDCLNIAISNANGKYLARMDCDDIAMTNRFALQVKFLESHPEYVVCGSSIIIFNPNNNQCFVPYPQNHEAILTSLKLHERSICHPTAMLRASALKSHYITYSNKHPHAEDYHLWTQLSVIGKMHNINKPLLRYRHHSAQVSMSHSELQSSVAKQILASNFHNFLNQNTLSFDKGSYIDFLVHSYWNEQCYISLTQVRLMLPELLKHIKHTSPFDYTYAKKLLILKSIKLALGFKHTTTSKITFILFGVLKHPKSFISLIPELLLLARMSKVKAK